MPDNPENGPLFLKLEHLVAFQFTELRPLHPLNAPSPIEVMELGIVTEVMPLQPENALWPMEVTELGMVVFLQPVTKMLVSVSMIALQLSRESYLELPASTTMLASSSQPLNALLLIEVIVLGIVTEVKTLLEANAQSPIDVTVWGIVVFLHPLIKVLLTVSIMALQLSRES